MRPELTLFGTVALSAAALAAPVATLSESWPIPSLEVHFMGRDSGLPGNEWPETSKFNSTLDFDIDVPSGSVACHGSWKEKEIPTTPINCDVEGLEFQLSPTSSGIFTEAAFVLSVRKTTSNPVTGDKSILVGTQEIRSNRPGEPNSYLSCLGGRPLDGIRCKNTGWASTAGPLVLSAEKLNLLKH